MTSMSALCVSERTRADSVGCGVQQKETTLNEHQYILDPVGTLQSGAALPPATSVKQTVLLYVSSAFLLLSILGGLATFGFTLRMGFDGFLKAGLPTVVALAFYRWIDKKYDAECDAELEAARIDNRLITGEDLNGCTAKYSEKILLARQLVYSVMTSEASRDGWIGDVDFSHDLYTIASVAIKASTTQHLLDEMDSLPDRTVEDNMAVEEGKELLGRLDVEIAERISLLQKAADGAHSIDDALDLRRTNAMIAERREELRIKLTSASQPGTPAVEPPGRTTDLIESRVAAFHDVQEIIAKARGRG